MVCDERSGKCFIVVLNWEKLSEFYIYKMSCISKKNLLTNNNQFNVYIKEDSAGACIYKLKIDQDIYNKCLVLLKNLKNCHGIIQQL